MQRRVAALDGVRGIAILMVMSCHFLILPVFPVTSWGRVMKGGWLGVDLFFVLSGYLITGILLDTRGQPGAARTFFMRRALRIFPLYYAVVLVAFGLLAVWPGKTAPMGPYDGLGWYLTYAANVAIAVKGKWLQNPPGVSLGHFWSLAVEEQFYLVWPWVVWWLGPRRLWMLCVALFVASPYCREAVDGHFGAWSTASYVLTPCRMDALAAGAFLACRTRLWSAPTRWEWAAWGVAGTAAAAHTVYTLATGGTQWGGTIVTVAFAAFVHAVAHAEGPLRRLCEHRVLCAFGTYSYGLYVFHHALKPLWVWSFGPARLTPWLGEAGGQIVYFMLAAGATWGVAQLSWRYLEQPFLRLKDRWTVSTAATASAGAAAPS